MITAVLVALGGAIGAIVRYATTNFFQSLNLKNYYLVTMSINIIGSFLLGLSMNYFEHITDSNLYKFIAIGILGGYTTFSTASYESNILLQQRKLVGFLTNLVGTLILALIAFKLGLTLNIR